MKKRILNISTLIAVLAFASTNVQAQQGFGTNQPSKVSAIEMRSDSKGLLIPRVALTELTEFGPIKGGTTVTVADASSLLVYNTATATGLTPGYYYWTTTNTVPTADGTVGTWKRLMANDDITALTLNGDVTGSLTANTVAKIQGRDVLNTAPTNNQVLTWNGTAWEPATITPAQIGGKAALTTQDGIAITAGTGTDALLAAATIGITNGGIAPVKIEPAQGTLTNRMVMVTQTDGTVTWIPQTDIAPTTTNELSFGTGLTATELTSTVNGISSKVDIAPVVLAAQKTTTVVPGTNVSVTPNPATPNATGNTAYTVNVATANGRTLGVVREVENNPSVTINANGELAVNPANVTITNILSSSVNTMSSTVNGGTAQTALIINSNALSLNDTNQLVSTVNGEPSAPLSLGPAITANTTHTLGVSGNTLTSTVNGVAPTTSILNGFSNTLLGTTLTTNVNGLTAPIDLAPAIKTGETLTNLTQSNTTGVITYQRERSTDQTVNVLSATSGNVLTFDGGVFLNATTIKSSQENTIVAGTAPVTVGSPSTVGNNKTYTVAVSNATAANVGVVKPGTGLTVATDGTLNAQASNGYSTTEYLTGKQWTNNAPVYEAVFTVTIATNEANSIIVPGTTKPAKILGMRMISQSDNSVTTEISRYDATTGTIVFGSGRTTQFQKVGTYDLILEYIK